MEGGVDDDFWKEKRRLQGKIVGRDILSPHNSFDYDDKARDRINAAIIALSLQGEVASIDWTTADNADTPVTANDLKMIIAAVAVRSNKLHTAYRVSKEKVEAATTAAEVEDVTFEV